MKWTVGTKIAAKSAFALFILIVLGVVSYRNATGYMTAAKQRADAYRVEENLAGILSAMKDAETGQRGYLIVGEDRYLKPYTAAVQRVNALVQDLRGLTANDAEQRHRLDLLEPLIVGKFAELKETIELRREKGFDAALQVVRTDKGKLVMDDIRKMVAEMTSREKASIEHWDNELDASSRASIFTVVYGIPLACIVFAFFGFLLTRSITHQLREGIAQLSSSAAEILATTTQVASGATETATAVSQTTATVEEVKQTAKLASQKARYVMESAQKASSVSQAGRTAVGDAVQGMHRIQEQMESVADSIVRLSEQTQAIGEIIATVNGLAEQSNLLAVNAAIEATKAGEQGKGFGVVAQEIRSLAEQSKQATAQVRTILGDIQKATSAAVLATDAEQQGG